MKPLSFLFVCTLFCSSILANDVSVMPLPVAETGQPRTRSASLCGFDGNLYFTRYWTGWTPMQR